MAKPWTVAEDAALVNGQKAGISYLKLGRQLDRTTDSIRNRAFAMGLSRPSGVPWYDELRLASLDIETVNFHADAGNMLCWALKPMGKPELYDCVTKEEQVSCKFDRRIVASLIEALKDVDVVISYYGTGFDGPYFKTRALMLGMTPPLAGDLYHFDCYYAVRGRLKLHRSSLDSACAAFGIRGKSHLDLAVWNKARVGEKTALAYVLEHNRQDVRILERLFKKIAPLQRWQRKPF